MFPDVSGFCHGIVTVVVLRYLVGPVANGAFPVKANGTAVFFGQQSVNITKIRKSHLLGNNISVTLCMCVPEGSFEDSSNQLSHKTDSKQLS